MKFQKMILLSLLAVGMTAFIGCQTQTEDPKKEDPVIDDKKEDKKDDKKENKPANIGVGFFKDSGLGRDECKVVANRRTEGSEYEEEVLITTDRTVYNVQVLDAEIARVDDKDTYFFINDIIYQSKKLTHDKPLIVKNEFNDMPNLLLYYQNKKGDTKIFSLSISGKDGSLIMEPALLEDTAPYLEKMDDEKQKKVPTGPYILDEDEKMHLDRNVVLTYEGQ